MTLVDIRRKHTTWAINQNPRAITITRTKKVRKQGAITQVTEQLDPIVARIYTKGGSPTLVREVQAERLSDRYYSMLVDYQADVQADVNTTDTFVLNGVEYKVTAVWEQTIHNEVVGYQCDVERVL